VQLIGANGVSTCGQSSGLKIVDIPAFIVEHLSDIVIPLSLAKREGLPLEFGLDDYVIVVKSGWLALRYQNVAVSLLRAGEFFVQSIGATTSRNCQPKLSLCVLASAELLLVNKAEFLSRIADRTDILFSMYALENNRNQERCVRAVRQRTEDIERQLAYFLWDLGTPTPSGERLIPSLNQEVVADCLGLRREAVTRKQKLLVEQGLLSKVGLNWSISARVGQAAAASVGLGQF
jgi:CRP-like cAMP-binding protein